MKRALIVLGVIITFALFFVFGFVISYLLNRNNSTVITKEVVSYVREIETVEESKFDEKYSIVNHQLCNLSFPLINNEIFQAEMEANGEIGNFDNNKHWTFTDREGNLMNGVQFTNTLDISYTYKPYINALGSGYTSGTITIQCAKNSDELTTEQVYNLLTNADNEEIQEVIGNNPVFIRLEDENKWDHDVIVYEDAMSMDSGLNKYVLATDTHIYLILFRSNTDNERLLKEVNYIFDNLSFN